jgi:hypothetical protein
MRKVEWESWNGHVCVLEMEDGCEEVSVMTGGDVPFMTQMGGVTEVFAALRAQSGYIRVVVDDVDEVASLVASAPIERPVRLIVDGEVAWKGFLACETFTQAWDEGPLEIELPVVSGLEVLAGEKPGGRTTDGGQTTDNGLRTTEDDLGYRSFARFLCEMNAKIGMMYERFIFPTLSEPKKTLRYQFTMENYATSNDDGSGHEMDSYYDILEDICKFFGWSVQERGASLIFQMSDMAAEYASYSAESMQMLADGELTDPVAVDSSVMDAEIYGATHSLDYMAGKKSVKIVGNINPYPSDFYMLDISGGKAGGAYGQEREADGMSTWYYTRNFQNGNGIETISPDVNIRYENFLRQKDDYSGCSMVSERVLKVEGITNAMPVEDSGWVDRILFRLKGMDYRTTYLTLKPKGRYVASGLTADKFFNFSMKVSKSSGYDQPWEAYEGFLVMRVTVGGVSLYDGVVAIREGSLRWSYIGAGIGVSGEGFNIGCPRWSGDVKVEFTVPDYSQILGFDDAFFESYLSIDEFSISYVTDWTKYLKNEEKKENQAKQDIEAGFTENYVSECGLTTYRENQFGTGIVIGADASATPPTTLYGGKSAEEALKERAVAVFSKSKKRLGVTVRGEGSLLDACKRYRVAMRDEEYICVGQSVNWKSDEVMAALIELDNEN